MKYYEKGKEIIFFFLGENRKLEGIQKEKVAVSCDQEKELGVGICV